MDHSTLKSEASGDMWHIAPESSMNGRSLRLALAGQSAGKVQSGSLSGALDVQFSNTRGSLVVARTTRYSCLSYAGIEITERALFALVAVFTWFISM